MLFVVGILIFQKWFDVDVLDILKLSFVADILAFLHGGCLGYF
jgi:hypothetical protein